VAFDFALRYAWVEHRPDEQTRAGIAFAFH
jgi:hypothetical protein